MHSRTKIHFDFIDRARRGSLRSAESRRAVTRSARDCQLACGARTEDHIFDSGLVPSASRVPSARSVAIVIVGVPFCPTARGCVICVSRLLFLSFHIIFNLSAAPSLPGSRFAVIRNAAN